MIFINKSDLFFSTHVLRCDGNFARCMITVGIKDKYNEFGRRCPKCGSWYLFDEKNGKFLLGCLENKHQRRVEKERKPHI